MVLSSKPLESDLITPDGGEADIEPLGAKGVPMIGLDPDSQHYFDHHRSTKDTLDKVNLRELEVGAMAMAALAYQIAQNGL